MLKVVSLVLFALLSTSAFACPDQTGKVIFSDNFSDDSGGWAMDSNLSYANSALALKVDAKSTFDTVTNVTFEAGGEADFCAEIAFPSEAAAADAPDTVGLMFLIVDDANRYYFNIYSSGLASVSRLSNNTINYLVQTTEFAAIKKEPGAVNELRVVYKNQKATFFVNGSQFKVARIPFAANATRFGFWAGSLVKPPVADRVTLVKSYEVAEPK